MSTRNNAAGGHRIPIIVKSISQFLVFLSISNVWSFAAHLWFSTTWLHQCTSLGMTSTKTSDKKLFLVLLLNIFSFQANYKCEPSFCCCVKATSSLQPFRADLNQKFLADEKYHFLICNFDNQSKIFQWMAWLGLCVLEQNQSFALLFLTIFWLTTTI